MKVPAYSRCTSVCFNVVSAKECSVFLGEGLDYNSFRLFFGTCVWRGKAIGDFLFLKPLWYAAEWLRIRIPRLKMHIRLRAGLKCRQIGLKERGKRIRQRS